MSETSSDGLRRILAFAAIVESATGLALMSDPAIVVRLLLGVEIDGIGTLLGRCFGIALLAFGVACWPGRSRTEGGAQAFRAMLVYNSLIALFLAYLGFVAHLGGVLCGLPPRCTPRLRCCWSGYGARNGDRMRNAIVLLGFVAAVQFAAVGVAMAQAAVAGAKAPAAAEALNLDVLEGAWVRPDGGYLILIKKVGPEGQLEATYFNPNPLPFAKARASRDGATLRLSFELQAGGYGGSTYELTYEPASDRLKGVYYQAVAKQKFEVYFVRK